MKNLANRFRILFLTAIVFVNNNNSFAQNSSENAYLLCKYKVVIVSDTNKRQNTQEDMAGLEITKNMSRYFSIYHEEQTRKQIEWKKNNGDKSMDVSSFVSDINKMGKPLKINKDYKSNQLTVFDNIANETFTFDEENPDFTWSPTQFLNVHFTSKYRLFAARSLFGGDAHRACYHCRGHERARLHQQYRSRRIHDSDSCAACAARFGPLISPRIQ